MKLYSTIQSERATKAQGANKSILATFTAEIENDRKKVVEVSMIYRENKKVYIEITTPHGETLRYTLGCNGKHNTPQEIVSCKECSSFLDKM